MLKGLHPLTGEQLTARLADDRLAGWDFTARLPKNVTAMIERGDERIMPLVVTACQRNHGRCRGNGHDAGA